MIDSSINRSADFGGNLRFPTRRDYSAYFVKHNMVSDENSIWENDKYVSAIHRHWHGEGRNGCIFALLAARRADEVGWQDYVITQDINEIEDEDLRRKITERIKEAIANPQCEILSILFSKITTLENLIRLIQFLLEVELIELSEEKEMDEMVILALRIPINRDGVLSWVMAFGPFEHMPQTRQSPITEIAIRVKPKPENQFHLLTPDKDAAHLADLPLDYSHKIMEQTWKNTQKRTRLILGGEPDEISAAKSTFSVPKALWKSYH